MGSMQDPRIGAVRAALDRVTDPELDESVVSLGFVASIEADDAGLERFLTLMNHWGFPQA